MAKPGGCRVSANPERESEEHLTFPRCLKALTPNLPYHTIPPPKTNILNPKKLVVWVDVSPFPSGVFSGEPCLVGG